MSTQTATEEPRPTDRLWDLGLAGAAELVGSGAVSATDVVEAVIARAAETEDTYHPYVHLDADHARAQAAASDARRAEGRELSAIDGLPFGIKDLLRTKDMPTRGGRHAGSDFEAERVDDTVVAALRATGAVIVGKHATHHFASGDCLSEARNAIDPRYFGGGSSAGGGVSVALGSSLGAIGTDSGGSVRIPAAFNGVVGFIPTGRQMLGGPMWGETSVSTSGIICRTAADIALAYPLIVPGHVRPEGPGLPGPDADLPLRGLRVGILPELHDGAADSITAIVRAAMQRMTAAGAEFVEGRVDGLADVRELFEVHSGYEKSLVVPSVQDVHRALNCTATSRRYLDAPTYTAEQYERAVVRRREVAANLRAWMTGNRIDVLLAPTTGKSPVPIGGMQVVPEVMQQTKFSLFANVFDCPAISLPCGVETTGMPVGLQLIGLPGTDIRVLQWAERTEPVVAS